MAPILVFILGLIAICYLFPLEVIDVLWEILIKSHRWFKGFFAKHCSPEYWAKAKDKWEIEPSPFKDNWHGPKRWN